MGELVFRLPDVAEGLEDAEVVEWRVAEGDRVELNQLIGELQTSKAAVEIPSPQAGIVIKLHAQPGELVRVGEPLVTFEVPDTTGPGVVGQVPREEAPTRRVRLRPPQAGRRRRRHGGRSRSQDSSGEARDQLPQREVGPEGIRKGDTLQRSPVAEILTHHKSRPSHPGSGPDLCVPI